MIMIIILIISLPLLIWIGITLLVMKLFGRIALDITKKEWGRKLGKFIGFMLVMGQFFISWTYEYFQLKSEMAVLCKTGGLKVYITPEEWRKQIGEKEWSTLYPEDKSISDRFYFDGNSYMPLGLLNRRVAMYMNKQIRINKNISRTDRILVDHQTNQVLMRELTFINGAYTSTDEYILDSLKFWKNNIQDCRRSSWSTRDKEYFNHYTNDQAKKGE